MFYTMFGHIQQNISRECRTSLRNKRVLVFAFPPTNSLLFCTYRALTPVFNTAY